MMFASMRNQLGSSEGMALAALNLLIQNMKAPRSQSDGDWIEDNHDLQPLDVEDQSERWLCPDLRKLEFENIGFDINDLWKFVKRRCASAGSPSRELQINVVDNIIYKNRADIPLLIAEKVVRLIGRENFSWDGIHPMNGNKYLRPSDLYLSIRIYFRSF
ncbi:hypothetical protein FRC02_005379 [Tulasnella sp. 418]|nr:hypothetical protein FRC02_005379 [Tulasnella sp. 418]